MVSKSFTSYIKKGLFWVLHLALIGTGFVFVQKTVSEFLDGKTAYYVTKSEITKEDIPTFTICFVHKDERLKHGTNFSFAIKSGNTNGHNHELEEGHNNLAQLHPASEKYGIPHQLVLKTLKVEQNFDSIQAGNTDTIDWLMRHCLKVSPIEETTDLSLVERGYVFGISFTNTNSTPKELTLYITSEQNAYGATTEKWYSGVVEPYVLKHQTNHYIHIKVKEYNHLQDNCQTQSYYQCLTSKLAENTTCGEVCSPVTLPTTTRFEDIEWDGCKHKEWWCRHDHFWSLFRDHTICKGKTAKSCAVTEYKIKDFALPNPIEIKTDFIFKVRMGAPLSSGTYLESKPYKIVYNEYYLLDAMQIIGTIGGTLGLMTGFSFLGTIMSITDMYGRLTQK